MIDAARRSAWAAGAAEVIVQENDEVRGRKLNRAAAAASSRILLFLHADTELPENSMIRVVEAIDSGHVFGGFRVRFRERHSLLPVAAAMINLRTSITGCPWGDQAQFVSREVFLAAGGFREYPLMEDYELAIRMKRMGRTILLPESVTTSGRRFLERGFLRTAALNWRIIAAYRRGADPFELEKLYRAT